MKKGPLSNKEKQYIEKNYKSKTTEQMAVKMKRSEHMVDKFIKTLSFTNVLDEPKNEEVVATPEVKGPKPGDLFARKEDRGVTIMTEAASIAGDESKSKAQPPKRYHKFIHKIKG